ncbi:hypothetical protein [Bacillus sp. KH172YL63]|uniref:hypothetical protein n=1 Tax=Bacillus sp. KH172YL63 TaxID=2709784 RepID=UPI0013E47577|nr:hypothetical protein [Bacillus sp. KH172YL63]BCB04314.1 hypothetical protein KH172YL63_24470 [Bacillus sp. KH172YL63]
MEKVGVKILILCVLILTLILLICFHVLRSPKEEWVKIEEKYYPGKRGAEGIGTGRVIDPRNREASCAMTFDNGRTFMMDCEEYLDFNMGEKVKIIYLDNKTVKLRRK